MPRHRSLPPHVELRRSGYFWRRRLPKSFHNRVDHNSTTIPSPDPHRSMCFSLRSRHPADATSLAYRLTKLSDQVFAAEAEMTMSIDPETQRRLLESLARFEIESFERTRGLTDPRCAEAAALDLRREAALQDTLRQALYLGDREVARRPLQNIAKLMGLVLDENDLDWKVLAYEATKVLLDVSRERAQRLQGLYAQPTVFFRRAVDTVDTVEQTTIAQRTVSVEIPIEPAAFATSSAIAISAVPAAATFATTNGTVSRATSPETGAVSETEVAAEAAVDVRASECTSALKNSTILTPVILPAGLECPDGYDQESWQKARIAARPPRILIDRKLLSEECRAALDKPRGITLPEAIALFFELRGAGYAGGFSDVQKRDPVRGAKWTKENVSNKRLAENFWPEILGDGPIEEIEIFAVDDALVRLWGVPRDQNRYEKFHVRNGYVDITERADNIDAEVETQVREAAAAGASAEEIDRIRIKGRVKRLKADTYLKHGRLLGAIGRMLYDMQLIDYNPFAICKWSARESDDMRKRQENHPRIAWDDRFYDFLRTPIFHGKLSDVADPLFWAPLIACHQGLRMEECVQLGPDDFSSDRGVVTMRVRNIEINGVKSENGERTLPVHPNLIELGLMKLVELRRNEKRIRLFPHLTRGKQKGTLSSNFSKKFGYYRKTNNVYWPGLDFHALRTTFHNDLLSDGGSDALRCRLMGHGSTDQGDGSYGQSLGIVAPAQWMESIVVDISMIKIPFKGASENVASRAAERGFRVI